jgi:hypothetical protein
MCALANSVTWVLCSAQLDKSTRPRALRYTRLKAECERYPNVRGELRVIISWFSLDFRRFSSINTVFSPWRYKRLEAECGWFPTGPGELLPYRGFHWIFECSRLLTAGGRARVSYSGSHWSFGCFRLLKPSSPRSRSGSRVGSGGRCGAVGAGGGIKLIQKQRY